MWLRRHASTSSCNRFIRMSIPLRLFSLALSHPTRDPGGGTVAMEEAAVSGGAEPPSSRLASSTRTAGRIASAWGPANACISSRRQRGSSRNRNGTATTRPGVEPCTGSGGPPRALIRVARAQVSSGPNSCMKSANLDRGAHATGRAPLAIAVRAAEESSRPVSSQPSRAATIRGVSAQESRLPPRKFFIAPAAPPRSSTASSIHGSPPLSPYHSSVPAAQKCAASISRSSPSLATYESGETGLPLQGRPAPPGRLGRSGPRSPCIAVA